MFEVPSTRQNYDAIRAAHSERAQVFASLVDALFHPFRRSR